MSSTQAVELQGRRLLIVEDDYVIASDLARALEDRGVEVVGPAGSVEDAMELIDTAELDGAVLDISLGEEKSYPIADELAMRGVPFVFASGYDAIVVPTAYSDVPRLESRWTPRHSRAF
jgi:ActR/RegA family two-component response regulator